jgi:tripartite-type tricarboxylate transporter receptor subunit TctC
MPRPPFAALLTRRRALAAPLVLVTAGAGLTARAQEAAWPGRAVTLIVPWAPGGSNDVVARMIAPQLEARFGQPFVVENRPGGGGSLGMGMVVRARPDGLTMLVSSASNHVFHPLISPDLGYQVTQALTGVCMLVDVPNVVAATNGLGVNSIPELVAKIRATRGGVAFASSGVGSSNHFAGELFRLRTGLDMTHVPYRGGGQAIADLIAGTVPVGFLNLPTVWGPSQAGRVKLLAVGTDTRVASRPEIPTVQEGGVPDYAVRSWTGLFAPRGTPAPVVERVAAALKEILALPALKDRLVDGGSEPIWSSPAETDAFVRAEYERWGPVVKAANIKAE